MKRIVVDCRTGKITKVDDGLPPAESPALPPEAAGLDLAEAAAKLAEIDELRARIEALEKK